MRTNLNHLTSSLAKRVGSSYSTISSRKITQLVGLLLLSTLSLIYSTLFLSSAFANNQETEESKMDNPHTATEDASSISTEAPNLVEATLAGGCFWCVEADIEKIQGVSDVVSGFSGGDEQNPSYKEVSSGKTGHTEVVHFKYDPSVVSYEEVLHQFWQHIDPTDSEGSFVDRGKQYRPAIFYHNDEQKKIAEKSIASLTAAKVFPEPIVIEVTKFKDFWPAEESHQDYYKKSPIRYKFYRYNSGRDKYTNKIWSTSHAANYKSGFQNHLQRQRLQTVRSGAGEVRQYIKPDDATIKATLTPLQYKVTQEDATERAFKNEYWDEKRAGIYVDIVSGEPLFSSNSKYDSNTGWPSFFRALEPKNIIEREDNKLFYTRTEVRSKHGDSHLGHLFDDGPEPTGKRYCINSAALKFIPVESLEEEGYAQYLSLFK